MMWTNNACCFSVFTPSTRVVSRRGPTCHQRGRRALEREHNRYVAMVVASDIVDDALEWMLEGWHFGERESRYSVAGYVPSLKAEGLSELEVVGPRPGRRRGPSRETLK